MADQINLLSLKEFLDEEGYPVSSNPGFNARDNASGLDYTYFNTNVDSTAFMYGQAYPGLLPEGFPGTEEPAPTLVSIEVTGTATAEVEGTSQLTATATYDDESTDDVTATAVWASSDDEVATVEAGLVTGVSEGTSNITASIGEVDSDPVEFTVTVS